MPQPNYRYTTSSAYGGIPPGVKWLLISNTAVFVIYALGGAALQELLFRFFALSTRGVIDHFYVWQLITYLFLHGGITHVLFNMLTLWFFGTPLERDWGTRRFLKYYFLCGLAAGVCVLLANLLVGDWVHGTIGASGALFGVLVGFAVAYPDQTVLMSFLFPIKAKYMVMIYGGIQLLLTLNGGNTGVSTVAHLGGMAFGYLYLKRGLPRFMRVSAPDIGGAYKRWKLARAKRKFQVYLRKRDGGGGWTN
jgi:membrane associated rhomboid family serine protease